MNLSENRRITICHEHLTACAENIRKKLSVLTNSAHDTTAVLAELTIMEGRLQDLTSAVRDSYYNG